MLCIIHTETRKAIIWVDKIEKGEIVTVIKSFKGDSLKSWFLYNPKLYRELTEEEKLRLL